MTTLTLNDGRTLGYIDNQGNTPIFFFHGQPGNRLFRLPTPATYRLITVDRPGYGLSDYQPERRISDWAADVLALADALALDRFGIIGHSAGGAYAAACACLLPASRLRGVALVSSVAPVAAAEVAVPPLMRVNQILRRIPPVWHASFDLFWALSRRNPHAFVDAAFQQAHASDRAVEAIMRPILQRTWEENLRVDNAGYVQEAALLLDAWNLPLNQASVPVSIWHGTPDTNAPIAWGHYLAEAFPTATLHEIPTHGHFALLVEYWQQILAAAAQPKK